MLKNKGIWLLICLIMVFAIAFTGCSPINSNQANGIESE